MKKTSGFTLIEMIIVIGVFSIGIFAVIKLVTNNLDRLDEVKNRNIATFLAKEGIELVFNTRDTNIHKELDRDCIFQNIADDGILTEDNYCNGKFGSGLNNSYLQISISPDHYINYQWTKSRNFENNRLYYHTGIINNNYVGRYDHNTGTMTKFARYILFTGIVEDGKSLDTEKIIKVESHVIFQRGTRTGAIVLESFIGNH